MGAIKRTPADIAFSHCVRASVSYVCQRCGADHSNSPGALDCSHHFSRGNWSVRFDPWNAEALCYGCHAYIGGTEERMRQVMTGAQIELLREKKNDTALGKLYRKTRGVGEIAAHYRAEHQRIKSERAAGKTGVIEFEAFL